MDGWLAAAFALHLCAACALTFGVHARCRSDLWLTVLRSDSYGPGGEAVWVDAPAACWAARSAACEARGLPLYSAATPGLGWHLFALLSHFEWISASFALYYLQAAWPARGLWWAPAALGLAGTAVCCVPVRGTAVAGEPVLYLANWALSAWVFSAYREVTHASYQEGDIFVRTVAPLVDEDCTRAVHLAALRLCEYCITAPALYLGVLCVFVADPPVFMAVGGYAGIALCNLYGLLLHYSLVTADGPVAAPVLFARPGRALVRRVMALPAAWLQGSPPPATFAAWARSEPLLASVASNATTLFMAWLCFALAMGLVLYQQTFLLSPEPPAFVVFAGWALLAWYSSFGVWATAVYLCLGARWALLARGLDALSVSAKLSIVGALAGGFVFQAGGRC